MSTVLVAIPSLLVGGTEIQTLRLVEALNDAGHHVVTVCYFEYDFTMVQRFKSAGSKVVCLSAYGNRPAGVKEQRKFLKAGLKRVVEEYRPKIAHVQYMAPGAIPILILHRLGVKTILATLHTDADIYKDLRLIHFLQKYIVTAFTCVTQTAEQHFFGSAQLFGPDTQLAKRNHLTIYNCLEKEVRGKMLDVRCDEHLSLNSQITIGFVGRLEPIKGADLILPAFAELLKLQPDASLRIVGDGSLRQQMEQQQRDLGIPKDNVTWVGRVEHSQLAEQYQQMDLVWMPSRSEGFGLSAIEAMAYGKPVVASQVGGLPEIITDAQDGLLFPKENIQVLAAKTHQLLQSPDQLHQLSLNAYTRSQAFTYDIYKTKIQNLYAKLNISSK